MLRQTLRCSSAVSASSFARSPSCLNMSSLFRKSALSSSSVWSRRQPQQQSARFSNVSNISGSFLSGSNGAYIEEMYHSWKADPSSVHKSWDAFFRSGVFEAPPSLVAEYSASASGASAPRATGPKLSDDSAKVVQMVRAFQVRGHLIAKLDPLNISGPRAGYEDLKVENYGFSEADMDRVIDLSGLSADVKGFLDKGRGPQTLRQIYNRLQETYCNTIGYEYMHIQSVDKCNWLRERIETSQQQTYSKDEKVKILNRLIWADHFESFLAKKFTSAKRFGVEGGESSIAGLKALVDRSATLGVEGVVIGMPHRGRLNVLSNVCHKPLEQILCEFEGTELHGDHLGSGDVKYHLGFSHDRQVTTSSGEKKNVHLTLLANPSHLEAVNPVVCGKTRAKQVYGNDEKRAKTMGLLLHGDAAFAGQGIVYETFLLSGLENYSTGGTIHVVINNQVGFTTDPTDSRSTPYCTDIAKSINAPVFHVNADDPEAVVRVCELAAEWRQHFGSDVVVDIVCFRKHGHNEIDEPSFTQPQMYQVVRGKQSTLSLYSKQLIDQGVITKQEYDSMVNSCLSWMEKAYTASRTYKPKASDWLTTGSPWQGFKGWNQYSEPKQTGVDEATLKHISQVISTIPSDFNIHPRLKTVYDKKAECLTQGKGIDWGTAEALAFGSLLLEGKHVRLSGQDVRRGTFSHRHATLFDQKKAGHSYTPLSHLHPQQAKITLANSPLSEFAVLGFELGYSQENPNALVLWEGQFGDFFNGAQIIVDQFISSQEEKWYRQTGLVMLLPHGFEGQGPEHSSARLERFLQNSNDHPDQIPDRQRSHQIQRCNWQVMNATTPANYFHALRRQIHRDFRKPLIVMSPKSLLRLPAASSSLAEMATGTHFEPVLGETHAEIQNVKRVVLCTGKVYYDLLEYRQKHKINNVALVRVEQISPFPFHRVADEVAKYPNADVLWCQEEPMNMGAYTYVKPRIESTLRQLLQQKTPNVKYSGRAPSASPAAGHHHTHVKEQQSLLSQAFAL